MGKRKEIDDMENLTLFNKWILQCNSTRIDFELATKQANVVLKKIHSIDDLNKIDDDVLLVQLLESLSYFTFNKDLSIKQDILQSGLDRIWDVLNGKEGFGERSIDILTNDLKPHLLRVKSEQSIKNTGLNPRLGLSMKEDDIRDEWVKSNEVKYIGLFNLVLRKLQHKDISSNLWWIIPGILNLMDDTSYFEEIKLPSIKLFDNLLDCFGRESEDNSSTANNNIKGKWIPIQDSGLFNLFEPILKKMLYFTPPSFPQEQTLQIWTNVYPTLIKLYQKQFSTSKYREMLLIICNEVILQHSIPRSGFKHETLLMFALNQLLDMLTIVGESSVLLLQRIIYVVGETLVKDPFFTLFDGVVDKMISLISHLVQIFPIERIVAHQFDIMGLILLITIKCDQEGKLESTGRLVLLRQLVDELQKIGVDTMGIRDQLIESNCYRDVIIKLFT